MTSVDPGSIHVNHVVKRFGGFEAVKGVSFHVNPGEVLGLLGPNGAGKSTLIRMMTALMPLTAGEVLIDGHSVTAAPDAVRKSIGVLPQAMTSDTDLTVEENLSIYAKLYGVGSAPRKKNIEELLEAVDLVPKRKAMVKTLSGGMRRRMEIARGLIHSPKVFFLDEPTTGLDPVSRVRVWELLKRLNQERGITMLLTTHYMDEADFLCGRIAIVDQGTLVALDTANNLKKSVPGGTLVEVAFKSAPPQWLSELGRLPEIQDLRQLEDATFQLRARNGSKTITDLLDLSLRSGVELASIAVKPTTLDDVFVHFTGHVIADKGQGASHGRRKEGP
ncbi:ABC transporter ATP-binding protein [Geothrix sp. 21YS21S-4]|uniref:ABC transporter ATP-binding protein n=1 Tax=Geothrix sp. 21YS21S-4 TaxID=3068889 RepID=UPI0027B98782|nr:ATP-binding cassette domain-containing protein [Geothrix sp. 21YS21S-4]